MAVTCRDIPKLAETWSLSLLDEAGLGLLVSHLQACPECRRRHPGLLELAARDAGILLPEREAAGGSPRAEGLREGLLSRLAALPPPRPAPSQAQRRRRAAATLVPVAAFAAFLFIALYRPFQRHRPNLVVRFSLVAPDAESVHLAGDFDSWTEEPYAMRRNDADGSWELSVRLRRGRSYRYNFIIDGETWIVDPAAEVNMNDGFGSASSLLRI